jgi:hypothetical protein
LWAHKSGSMKWSMWRMRSFKEHSRSSSSFRDGKTPIVSRSCRHVVRTIAS